MDYEKEYKEALERAKYFMSTKGVSPNEDAFETAKKLSEYVFPQLKESEDERIRKALIELVHDTTGDSLWVDYNVHKEDVLAWFEKQNEKVEPIESFDTEFEKQISRLIASIINKDYEYTKDFVKWTSDALLNFAKHEIEKQYQQKPTDEEMKETLRTEYEKGRADVIAEMQKLVWSEEDTEISSMLIELVESKEESMEVKVEFITWIRSLKNKILPKPKQGWSEEDEKMLEGIIECGEHHLYLDLEDVNWIKSIKDRYTWKPSKEQMKALEDAIEFLGCTKKVRNDLKSLYEQLKKLREG